MEVRRGEIWWAGLGEPVGSAPGYRRPVLIVQANEFNRSRIRTVLALAITSNLALAAAPGNVRLPRRHTGLKVASVANVSQIITVDKQSLVERAGRVPDAALRLVEDGLRMVLALDGAAA